MNQSVQTAYSKIKDWDLTAPKHYLIEKEGYEPNRVAAMEPEYKRFLALSRAIEGTPMPISAEVDPLWHAHILFTHDYTKLCVELGGEYVHHVPAVTQEDIDELREFYITNTLPLYEANFGKPDETMWGTNAQICMPGHCFTTGPTRRATLIV